MLTTSPQPTRAPSIHELDGLLGFIPVAGPPVVLLVGPLVLCGLLVAGPFLAMVTIAVVLVLALAIVALAALIVASPYLLIRHFAARGAETAEAPEPAPVTRPAPSFVRPTSRSVAA